MSIQNEGDQAEEILRILRDRDDVDLSDDIDAEDLVATEEIDPDKPLPVNLKTILDDVVENG